MSSIPRINTSTPLISDAAVGPPISQLDDLYGSSDYSSSKIPTAQETNGDAFFRGITELVAYFLGFIPTENVGSCLYVCSEWHDLMITLPELRSAVDIEKAKGFAENIEDPDARLYAYQQIITVEAKLSIGQAKRTLVTVKQMAPFFENPDIFLRNIVSLEVLLDMPSALLTFQGIQPSYEQLSALLYFAQLKPQVYLETIKREMKLFNIDNVPFKSTLLNSMQIEVVKIEASFNLLQAKETAQSMVSPDVALVAISQQEAKVDPILAFQTALSINDVMLQAQALFSVVLMIVKTDLERAKAVTSCIKFPFFLNLAQVELIKSEILIDLEVAKQTTLSFTDPFTKAQADLIIAQAEPGAELEKVIDEVRTVATTLKGVQQEDLLINIAKIEFTYSQTKARETISELKRLKKDHEWEKTMLFQSIVQLEISLGLITEAEQTIFQFITDPDSWDMSLLALARAKAAAGISPNNKFVKLLKKTSCKIEAFLTYATSHARSF